MIQITKPEAEEIVHRRIASGAFKDVDDVILQALQSSPPYPARGLKGDLAYAPKSLREVFEAIRGIADDVAFDRNPSAGRPMESL